MLKIKENNERKSIEVDLTNFIKVEVESFSDAVVYTDDDYSEMMTYATKF